MQNRMLATCRNDALLDCGGLGAVQAETTKDAIPLYNLAQKDDTVGTILDKELGATLMDPTSSASIAAPGGGAPGVSFTATEDLTSMAFEVLSSYEWQGHIVLRISVKNRETCKVLRELKPLGGVQHWRSRSGSATHFSRGSYCVLVTDADRLWHLSSRSL